jgi:predicted RNase H-like nuclease (RuvC/YqgF family)
MMHLARVKKKDPEGKAMLQLLAQQKAEYAWVVLDDEDNIWVDTDEHQEGALVLVELSPLKQVEQIYDATRWVLEIVEQYLALGITPTLLQEEVQRAEQWRQSLTLKEQELGRRSWEVEARREQIQELEENLRQEKQALDTITAQLKTNPQLKAKSPNGNGVAENGVVENRVMEKGVTEISSAEPSSPEDEPKK